MLLLKSTAAEFRDWTEIGQAIRERNLNLAYRLFQPHLDRLTHELQSIGEASPLLLSILHKISEGDVDDARERVALWIENSNTESDLNFTFLKSIPDHQPEAQAAAHLLFFMQNFQHKLARRIKRVSDTVRRATSIGQLLIEPDITYETSLETDYFLIDFLKQQDPWLWHYANQRYHEWTQKEIGAVSHMTRRTLIEDEKRLWRLLKKKL